MVHREGDKVWIEGAKEIFHRHFDETGAGVGTPWAERSDTYMYLAQMRIAGWEADYADLITIAGYGPSFAYAPGPKDRWGAHYFPISGRDDRIAHATGYRNHWRQLEDPEDYWQALKSEIDAGRAVHGPNEEDILFIGYVDAENPEDRKVMPVAIVFVEDDEWTWEQFVRWHSRDIVSGWFGAFEQEVAPWPARESAIEVIEMMVQLAQGDDSRRKAGDGVVWGIDGIVAYADDLADLSKSGAPEPDGGYFQGGWRGCHNVMPQMSGRPAAAAYLKKVAPLFEGETRAHLEAAAAAYDSATAAWREFDRNLGRALEGDHATAWQDPDHRSAGSEAVRRAAAHEREAIATLEQALESLSSAGLFPDAAQLSAPIEADAVDQTGNSLARGLAIILRHAGCDLDYPAVMGYTGQAFATQGTIYDPDQTGGYADIGWWPLDLFHMESRLPFLSEVSGRVLTMKWADFDAVSPDPKGYYRTHFENTVRSEIAAGRPALSVWHAAFVVTGYDTGEPPLQGWCVAAGEAEHMRADDYPKAIYTYGEPRAPLDRGDADRQALGHAVALGRGTAPAKGLWVTGPGAWQGWRDRLIAKGSDGPHFWHANQRMQLVAWRRCAIEYLEAMRHRHDSSVATHLADAVATYEHQIECLSSMRITPEAIVDPGDGRQAMADLIEQAAALDAQAIDALEKAVRAM